MATVEFSNLTGQELKYSGTHTPDCPLWRRKRDQADTLIDTAACYGLSNSDAQLVAEAILGCERCKTRFQERRRELHQGEYEHARRHAQGVGDMQEKSKAYEAGRIWFTKDIEREFASAPRLRHLYNEEQVWRGLFRAFISLAREACDVRHPELPYVRFKSGLIPKDWSKDDVLEYIASEVEVDDRIIEAGLTELETLLLKSPGNAAGPLGWFFPEADGGCWLIGWKNLLEPEYGYVGTRTGQENTDPGTNSLSKETADFLKRIQEAARAENVTV